MVENRLAGAKSREIYEAPAAVVLHAAHRELQPFVTPRDLERLTAELGVKYADLVYNGAVVHADARGDRRARRQGAGSGSPASIRLKLFKGDCRVVGRQSPHRAYEPRRRRRRERSKREAATTRPHLESDARSGPADSTASPTRTSSTTASRCPSIAG